MTDPKFEIKKYRSCRGHDGDACSFDLWVDGEMAAAVNDDGWGGGFCYHWKDRAVETRIRAWVDQLPPIDFQGEPLKQNLDIVLEDYIERAQEEKQIRGWCKKRTVLLEPNAKPGQYIVYGVRFSPPVKSRLQLKHPLAEFVNERFM